jgi:hypothetical protein
MQLDKVLVHQMRQASKLTFETSHVGGVLAAQQLQRDDRAAACILGLIDSAVRALPQHSDQREMPDSRRELWLA